MVLDVMNDADTAVLGSVYSPRAYLVRNDTSEEIPITKEQFSIGRSRTNSDYYIGDRIVISRSHAAILFQGGKYYITDLNSNNKTFLNDMELAPNRSEEIVSGSRIRLADLEFIFYME